MRALPPDGPRAALIRLFVANVPVPIAAAAAALAPLDLDQAAAMRLLAVDGDMAVPAIRLVPVGPVLIACDRTPDVLRLAPDVTIGVSARPGRWPT